MFTGTKSGDYLHPAILLEDGRVVAAHPLDRAADGQFPLYSLSVDEQEWLCSVIYNFKAVSLHGQIYVVAEHAADPQERFRREILLLSHGKRLSLSGYGKFTNPQIVPFQNRLFICCEEHGAFSEDRRRQCRILVWSVAADLSAYTLLAVSQGCEREYIPQLAASSQHLLLITEAFGGGRYRLLARILNGTGFGRPAEVGTDADNDQSPSITVIGDRFYLFLENSQCLHKDYVYPLFPEYTIPSFGHGWRINTRMYGRQMAVEEDAQGSTLLLSPLQELFPGEGKSNGVCTAYAADGGLFLAYYRFDPPSHQYTVSVCAENDGEWVRLFQAAQRTASKKPISLCLQDRTLYISHLTVDSNIRFHIEAVPLSVPLFPAQKALSLTPAIPLSRKEATITAVPRPSAQTEDAVFYGDLHMHSNISICSLHFGFHCSEIEDKYRICSDLAGLDFAMCTDHDNMSQLDWARTCAAADFAYIPDTFVAFNGYEWTSSMFTDGKPNFGHQNILYKDKGPLLRCRGTGTDHVQQLWSCLEKEGVKALTIPHHTGDAMHPFDWSYHHPQFQRVAEIFNVRGSYEYDGCPLYPLKFGRPTLPGLCLDTPLKKGYHLGFTSGGEHEGCGITMVRAKALTREALFDALFERRVYGSSGTKMLMKYTAGDVYMGGTKSTAEPVILHFSVTVPSACPIAKVRLMKNSLPFREWSGNHAYSKNIAIAVEPEDAYYYFAVEMQDGEMGWSSPIWIKKA